MTVDQQYLLDRLAISDFLTTYAHAVDAKDWDLYRSLFTADAHIDYTAAGGIAGTLAGLRSVDEGHRELFQVLGATRVQAWFKLGLPSALPCNCSTFS